MSLIEQTLDSLYPHLSVLVSRYADNQATMMTPWLPSLSAKWIKFFRFGNTLLTVGILAYCAYITGPWRFPFYMTNWASAFTMLMHLTISGAYF